MDNRENFLSSVVGATESYFSTEGINDFKILREPVFNGKTRKCYADIYYEFFQMNTLQRSIGVIVAGRTVEIEDVLNLVNTLDGVNFKANGILYYNKDISSEAVQESKHKIILKRFNFSTELVNSIQGRLRILLPDESVIGDPFWIAMEVDEENQNTGNYNTLKNDIPLFFSKRQAIEFAKFQGPNSRIFGLTQNHLKILVNLMNQQNKKLLLIKPAYVSLYSKEFDHLIYAPGNKNILKWYSRSEENV